MNGTDADLMPLERITLTTAVYPTDLGNSEVTRLVRKHLHDPTWTVASWQLHPITSGRSGAQVYRLRATGLAQTSHSDCSLILKFCSNVRRFGHCHNEEDPSWQREYLLAESGLVTGQVSGLQPARCIDGIRLSPTEIALWFEDVGHAWADSWSVERYGEAAFHLGQFNARFAGQPPQEPWLGRDQWPRYVQAFCPEAVASLRKHQDHPAVLAVYPHALQDRLYAIDKDCPALIESARAGAVLTLTHGDPGGRNLFDCNGETVAIDWDEVGISPLGEEVARMVGSSLHWFFIGRMQQARELVDLALSRYLDGLRDAGCRHDATAVALVFKAVLGTIYALSYVGIANGIVEDRIAQRAQGAYHTTVPQLLEHMGAIASFCADQADEARALAAG